jgi:hypothetical protein
MSQQASIRKAIGAFCRPDFGENEMDAIHVSFPPEALTGEAFARSFGAPRQDVWSIPSIKQVLDQDAVYALDVLVKSFGIGESAVGLMALLHELTKDLATLRPVFAVPQWAEKLEVLNDELRSISKTDHIRDSMALQSQPPSALRTFLTPFASLKPNQHRAVRALRGLVSLQLLSNKEHLGSPLADAVCRCVRGKSLQRVATDDIAADRVRDLRRTFAVDSPEARLLTLILEVLELPLPDPFQKSVLAPGLLCGTIAQSGQIARPVNTELIKCPSQDMPKHVPDPLKGFQLEEISAGIKIFSGIPDIYRGLMPFELEPVLSSMGTKWQDEFGDERLAAWLTLLIRVMPQHFNRVPLHADGGAGLWLDLERGVACWNLDQVLASHKSDSPFVRSEDDRHTLIPLPIEVLVELRRRFAFGKRTLASLFREQEECLGVTTKRFLRQLSITSHRPTLSRLSDTWARYLLHLCKDEVYASALGIDFTVGTPSNFNYATLRAERIRDILANAYQRVGLSGKLGCEDLPDIHSRRLPAQETVSTFVESALHATGELIASFPKRASVSKLKAVHNQIALAVYGVFKIMSGGRALREETVSFSRMDLASGLTELCDKRTAPYHERRVIRLPPTLLKWMAAYVAWLRLVAYRLSNEDRRLSEAIASTLDSPLHGDRVPLFFAFSGKNIRPLGSQDLTPAFEARGLKSNAGRHFIDAILRGSGLDSAAIMGWAGRGYPGQEIYGRGSVVIPEDALCECAMALEGWLSQLTLPEPPLPVPRAAGGLAPTSKNRMIRFVPELLRQVPQALAGKIAITAEPCPYQDSHVLEASLFPRIFRAWRSAAPMSGWPGVALSLILEDGVILEDELIGVLTELRQGVVYRHERDYFVDTRTAKYGIRRVWLSPVTVRLLYKVNAESSENADLDTLDPAICEFVRRSDLGVGSSGIAFVQRCLRAFAFFRMPALLHAWARGDLFARVSRPQTVARKMFACCEHSSYEQRYSRRVGSRFNDFETLHRKASEALEKGAADKTVLNQFAGNLALLQPNYEPDSLEWYVVGYARYLCQTQIKLSTVTRYLTGCRPFLKLVVAAIAEGGGDQVNWHTLALQCLDAKEESSQAPDRAAINHCLAWLGIDERIYFRSGPPPAAFNYADLITEREAQVAIDLLRSKQNSPGDVAHRASLALSLLLAVELRWDELACLRQGDICLLPGRAHLVITRESGAALKSANARRVIALGDPVLVSELRVLQAQRAARFPLDPLAPLFGDETESRAHDSLTQVHDLIADAVWCASGSDNLRVHDTRATGLTRKIGRLLDPEFRKTAGRTLDWRQAVFRASSKTGHVTFGVSLENYVHDLDVKRREWLDRMLQDIDIPTRPSFAEGVTTVRAATYRQRASRGPNSNKSFDFWEGFDAAAVLQTGGKIRDLAELVVPNLTVVGDLTEQYRQNELVGSSIYVGLRFLGEPCGPARLAAGLPIAISTRLEEKIRSLQRMRYTEIQPHAEISRDEFIDAALESALVVAMESTAPHAAVLRRLMASVKIVGEPWELLDPADFLEAGAWIHPLKAAGIEPRLELKTLGRSRLDDEWIQRCSRIGLQARTYPASHFRRGIAGLVKFGRVGTGNKETHFRASPQLTFLATTSLFAIGIFTNGNENGKKAIEQF